MKILVVTPYYKPDGGAQATLSPLLCEQLAKRGHEVYVLTSVPHYPSGRVPGSYKKNKYISVENGVKICRINLPSIDRKVLAARLYQFVAFQVGAIFSGFNPDYDVLLTHTSALEVVLTFVYFSSIKRKPAIYSVDDLYPEVGITQRIFRNFFVIKIIGLLENYCLRNSKKVRILSRSFAPILIKKGLPESKLALIYDWVDTEVIRPLPRENDFSLEHGLTNNFVILYTGNIGLVQGLDTIIDTAILLSDDPEIYFVIVGDGARKNRLVEKAHNLRLSNIHFIPYQPSERMPEVYASSDISLVTLQKGIGFGALPYKTFQILASGRPLIVSVDEGSDTWDVVKSANAGLCVAPENPEALSLAIRTLKKDIKLRTLLGRNGRIWVEQHNSPQYAAVQIEKLLFEAVASQEF